MRNTYKVISWDKTAGRGFVTDGTRWKHELQTILVQSTDLEDDFLQGFLIPGEVISAEEDMNRTANRKLTDILVENGSRSIPARAILTPVKQAEPEFNPSEMPIDSQLYEPVSSGVNEALASLGARLLALESRVAKLEGRE